MAQRARGSSRPGRAAPSRAEAAFDVLMRGGTVFDGLATEPLAADVGLKNGLIARVGDLGDASASRTIAAEGLYVAAGSG